MTKTHFRRKSIFQMIVSGCDDNFMEQIIWRLFCGQLIDLRINPSNTNRWISASSFTYKQDLPVLYLAGFFISSSYFSDQDMI